MTRVTDDMVERASAHIRGGSNFSQEDREDMARAILSEALPALPADLAGLVEGLRSRAETLDGLHRHIDAGLPGTYISWSQAIYSGDITRALLKGETE